MIYKGFIGPSYTAASPISDCEQTMNLFPELVESGTGKNVAALYMRPGLTAPFTTLATTPVRALWTGGDPNSTERLFGVGGSKLIEITSAGALTVRGDVGDDATHTPATILANGNQLGIVSAGKFYCDNGAGPVQPTFGNNVGVCSLFNIAGTGLVFSASGAPFDSSMVGGNITIGGAPYVVGAVYSDVWLLTTTAPATGTYTYSYTLPVTAGSGTFLDGYFIVARPDSKIFNISAINDGTTWDALDYGVKEGYPDNIATIFADHELLWLLGTETIEPWQNTGAANFPFQRVDGAVLTIGCRAKYSVSRIGTVGFAFIGGNQNGQPVAYLMVGFTPKRISTAAVENAWQGYSTISDAIGYTYEDRGHQFWVVSFPTADKTWVYDPTTDLWHERGWWNGTANGRERGRCHAFCYGKHLVGDYSSGAIYQSSSTTYSDNGTAIHWSRTAPHISAENHWMFYRRFQLDMEVGDGNSPVITLEWSNDGGRTYSPAVTTTAGALANYTARVIFRRLGKARDRVFRVSGSNASKTALINSYIDFEEGNQ